MTRLICDAGVATPVWPDSVNLSAARFKYTYYAIARNKICRPDEY